MTNEVSITVDETPRKDKLAVKEQYLDDGYEGVRSISNGTEHIYHFRKEVVNVQCKGITEDGDRCKMKTDNPNGYCRFHQDQAEGE